MLKGELCCSWKPNSASVIFHFYSLNFFFFNILFYSYLSETMAYLLGSLRRERERYNVFNAIGLLAVAVKQDIKPYIPKIMEVIRASLPSKDLTIRYACMLLFRIADFFFFWLGLHSSWQITEFLLPPPPRESWISNESLSPHPPSSWKNSSWILQNNKYYCLMFEEKNINFLINISTKFYAFYQKWK